MKTLILVAIAGLLLPAGCGQAAPSPAPTSTSSGTPGSPSPAAATGISGRVLLSGGPAPGLTQPYPHSEVTVTDSAGRRVAVVRPGPDARFTVAVPAGRYTVKARPTSGNPWFGPQTVTVRDGGYSAVKIYAVVP
jgi:hypothetical protein